MRRMIYSRLIDSFTIIILVFFINHANAAIPTKWENLAPGLDYTHINMTSILSKAAIHAFRVDLSYYQLKSLQTQDQNKVLNGLQELVIANHASLGINGGFFNAEFKSMGLRINNNRIINSLQNTRWWGIFFTRGSKAFIVSQREFTHNQSINFAIQSGPRLIINGKIPSLKHDIANRTALGITADNKVIILATEHYPLAMDELAVIMRQPENEGGLNCVNAINLDGGSSTQMYARVNQFSLSIKSFANVADIVLLIPYPLADNKH